MVFDDPQKPVVHSSRPSRQEESPRALRSVKRCPLVAAAEITEMGSGSKLSARTSELSIGGCYIDTLNPFPEGTLIQCRILRDKGVFETKAMVVYSHERIGMGVAFSQIAPNQQAILESWLAELVLQLRLTP
jgi:hypothetical protein